MPNTAASEEVKKSTLILIALFLIIVTGIFLRTFHFSDFLQFNPDQARDAKIVSDWISGQGTMPFFGPKAGGTEFHLGPIFYYFGAVSAKIFGPMPDKMAYPDLLFSILSIPLFYFFLKKYFNYLISLALTFIFSISFFVVFYSRFSWNPNQIPFFTLLFLFSILQPGEEKNEFKNFWALLFGISLAILIQLHTLLLVALPVFSAIVLMHLIKRKKVEFKEIIIIVLTVIFLNFGQIYSEIKTGGANVAEFRKSSNARSDGSRRIFSNIETIATCQIQSNLHIIYPTSSGKKCNLFDFSGEIGKSRSYFRWAEKNAYSLGFSMLSIIFSTIGYYLIYYFYRKEEDNNRKNFLKLVALYNLTIFLIFIPVASEMYLRYFIMLFFVPFILLGLWLKKITESKQKFLVPVLAVAVFLALVSNGRVLAEEYQIYASGNETDVNNVIMKDILPMADYIASAAGSAKAIHLAGNDLYLIRFKKSLAWFLEKKGIEIWSAEKNEALPIFYIGKTDEDKNLSEATISGRAVDDFRKFNKITIYKLKAAN